MKFLFFVIGLGGGVAAGLFPSMEKARPLLTRILTLLIITVVVVLALYPPIVGNFADAVRAKEMKLANREINVLVAAPWSSILSETMEVTSPDNGQKIILHASRPKVWSDLNTLKNESVLLLKVHNGDSHNEFVIDDVLGIKPAIMLPYIPALEERARILYFHVPMSWVGFLAFIVTLVCSIQFLRTNDFRYETKAAASAGIGVLFTALAYITGSLWAKFNWGKFFNGDAKEIDVLILLLIYGAYFALRSSIDDRERRSRLASVYAIISCVAALFLMFILPRMFPGLHPGSQDDSNAGPMLSAQSESLNTTKAIIFALSLSGFTMLYFWMLSLKVRVKMVEEKLALRASS